MAAATLSSLIRRIEEIEQVPWVDQDPYEILSSGVPWGIHRTLVDTLGVDHEEISPEATLVGDLGVESIDLLDIVFKLEKAFGIEFHRRELSPEDILENGEFVSMDKINARGIEALRRRMPYADLSSLQEGTIVKNFLRQGFYTVGLLKKYLEYKLVKFTTPAKT
jgi:acyl carrier protein